MDEFIVLKNDRDRIAGSPNIDENNRQIDKKDNENPSEHFHEQDGEPFPFGDLRQFGNAVGGKDGDQLLNANLPADRAGYC